MFVVVSRQEFVCEGNLVGLGPNGLVGRECFHCIGGMIGRVIFFPIFQFSLLSF